MTAQTDHAKRLAEDLAEELLRVADLVDDVETSEERSEKAIVRLIILSRGAAEQLRAASEALTARGAPASWGSLAERIATLNAGRMEEAARMAREIASASEALDALGVAPGSLAERVRALTGPTYSPPIAERHQRAEHAIGAGMRPPAGHLDRGILLAEVARQRRVIDRLVDSMTAALPDLGIMAAHGDTAQALAEDVASQVLFVVRSYALADEAALAPDALALRARVRARLGLDVAILRAARVPGLEKANREAHRALAKRKGEP